MPLLVNDELELRHRWKRCLGWAEPDRASRVREAPTFQKTSFGQGTLLNLKPPRDRGRPEKTGVSGEARASDTTIISNLEKAVAPPNEDFTRQALWWSM
jgi:hypothetical protein